MICVEILGILRGEIEVNKFNKKKLLVIISWTLVLSWMLFLFIMSSKVREDSDKLSRGITKKTVSVLEKMYPNIEINIDKFNYIIRKNAHFFGYLLLGIFISLLLRVNGVRGFKLFIYSLITCIVYAISDEVHQYFVPGRGPEIRDVIIDSLGSIIGITINFITINLLKRNKNRVY